MRCFYHWTAISVYWKVRRNEPKRLGNQIEQNLTIGRTRTRWARRDEHYRGELVAGIADEHAGLAHGAVPDRDALDELGHAHLSPPRPPSPAQAAALRPRLLTLSLTVRTGSSSYCSEKQHQQASRKGQERNGCLALLVSSKKAGH